jgi:hypothetical protein
LVVDRAPVKFIQTQSFLDFAYAVDSRPDARHVNDVR